MQRDWLSFAMKWLQWDLPCGRTLTGSIGSLLAFRAAPSKCGRIKNGAPRARLSIARGRSRPETHGTRFSRRYLDGGFSAPQLMERLREASRICRVKSRVGPRQVF